MPRTKHFFHLTLLALIVGLTGCGQAPAPQSANGPPQGAVASSSGAAKAQGHSAHDHSGWWCSEHGVPEDECGRCNAKLAAQLQKKGDWCKDHDRPESQCFVCHPEKEAQFAAKYEAKYGEKPPKPEID
jgi:cobalt-zinc-cadmium efflux system membrane fusion protein